MKAYVISNPEGKVVGHVRVQESQSKSVPTPGKPTPPAGHKLHEIEFPNEFLALKTAKELHHALEKHLKQAR